MWQVGLWIRPILPRARGFQRFSTGPSSANAWETTSSSPTRPWFSSAFATFNADVPDAELHELPGLCAHFVIDADGTIYQLVPLGVMCRHTVGLNWTAIGIEHVGMTDGQVMRNSRQMAASLALTAWLMSRFHIKLGDVIGHNESLTSRGRVSRGSRSASAFPRAALSTG